MKRGRVFLFYLVLLCVFVCMCGWVGCCFVRAYVCARARACVCVCVCVCVLLLLLWGGGGEGGADSQIHLSVHTDNLSVHNGGRFGWVGGWGGGADPKSICLFIQGTGAGKVGAGGGGGVGNGIPDPSFSSYSSELCSVVSLSRVLFYIYMLGCTRQHVRPSASKAETSLAHNLYTPLHSIYSELPIISSSGYTYCGAPPSRSGLGGRWSVQTHRRFKRSLFIRTKHSMQIFEVIPLIKLQNDT